MSANTDMIANMRAYVDKLVGDPAVSGMKALILDSVTTKIVSMVYSQSQILEKEIYLVELLGNSHEPMTHLKASVFVQPTEANITLLLRELKEPKFAEYHLYFSNIVPSQMITRLGRADENEVVRQVQEYFADYMVVNEDFFHLGVDNSLILSSSLARTPTGNAVFDRNVSGILSVLLSMKRRPSQVRYQQTSNIAGRLANEVVKRIDNDDVFDFRRQEGPLLLILDRCDDPVTPLLTQWTYQAMVHELLGLNNNRVVLKGTPGAKTKDLDEVVLSCTQDTFFSKHRYDNFGDLGEAIKGLLDDYQKNSKMNEKISSIEDMQAFMDRYPAFRSQAINVSKHVALMSELARLTDTCQLLSISQLEQEIACSNDHSGHKRELLEKISNPSIVRTDKIRLALLFLIRYESYDEKREIKQRLSSDAKANAKELSLLDSLVEYAGDAKRSPNLFSQGGIMATLGKQLVSSINGIENVYTQHTPLLSNILDSISKGKLKDSNFPLASMSTTTNSSRPTDVIVFIIGGATFEEALKVAEFNTANPQMKVVLGGSCVQNSVSFLKEVGATFSH